ncbi:MAG: hypothetical protein ACR2OH_03435 [Microthrixaceae bacterium]
MAEGGADRMGVGEMANKREWKLRATEAREDYARSRRAEGAARKKAKKYKRRAGTAERHAELLQELNTQLVRSNRRVRMDDRVALRETADALAAIAADASALREALEHDTTDEYLDYLTFRLRENLRETHLILERRGRPDHAAEVAGMLNELPPDGRSNSN